MLRRRQYRQRPENDSELSKRLRAYAEMRVPDRVRQTVAGTGQAGLENHRVGSRLLEELGGK